MVKGLGYKLLWTIILSGAVWSISSWVGFPVIFRIFFVGYVLLGFLFFLLLDAKAMRLPKNPILAIAAFFLAVSVLLTLAGMLLPQYNPGIEIEKIRRIQQMAIEQEQEKEREQKAITEAVEAARKELLAEMKKEGMIRMDKKVAPGGLTLAESVAEQIALGKQVYKDYECYNCHKVGGRGGVKRRGPALDNIGNLLTAEQLKEKLWDPMTWYAEGFENEYKKVVMPDNYPKLMSEVERDALAAYLMSLKDPAGNTPRPIFPPKKKEGGD